MSNFDVVAQSSLDGRSLGRANVQAAHQGVAHQGVRHQGVHCTATWGTWQHSSLESH